MPILGIDIETYSSVDLKKCGVYRYAEAPDFTLLLFGYAVDDAPVRVIDLSHERIPDDVLGMLTDSQYIKIAYNANFERVCLSRFLGIDGFLPPEQWRCTMVHAATLGLPRSLAEVGTVLGLPEDKQKMQEGKNLIRYFCVPCKPTKTNGGRTRNLPQHDLDRWRTFISYNQRDVEVERDIRDTLSKFPVPDDEWAAYWMDQRINDRGVRVDMELVGSAITISEEHTDDLTDEAEVLTGIDNVGSVKQLKNWLGHTGSLDKKAVAALREDEIDDDTDRVLAIRQELGKTSVTKYEAIKRGVCLDGRVRGLFAFYGANRTGRWAGRQVQVQNLPKNMLPDLDAAREIVKSGDRDGLQALFGNVPSTLSELIRTAFIPRDGYTFAVADFSAIEARVIAWLADERWRMELFQHGGKIYEASAEKMFHLPAGSVKKGDPMRQKGKIAELALGYGGSSGAMVKMGALDMGLREDELLPIVRAWRDANPAIVALWWQIDDAAKQTIREHLTSWRLDLPHGVSMRCSNKMFHIKLPSGRELRYWKPKLEGNKFGGESITYGSTEANKWKRVETYGPKLVENIVQAIARDCLRDAMMQVFQYPIVMHVHDEMITEVPKEEAQAALDTMLMVMRQPIPWAKGLILKGDGYLTDFYKKD